MTDSDEYEANTIDLELLADRVIRDKWPTASNEEDRVLEMEEWLRWGQGDEPETLKRWAWLTEPAQKGPDRDEWVLGLWRKLDTTEARDILKETVPWSFYQRHFFGWFLGRFDIQAARAVFAPWRLAGWLHEILALVIVVGAYLGIRRPEDLSESPKIFFLLLTFLLGTGAFTAWAGLPLSAYLNSLIPRLAAAVGIGYFALFSAPHLVQMINASGAPTLNDWLIVGALTFAPLFYIMFHIHRRVDPPLRLLALLRRSSSILALAIAYSALELLVAAPILFSSPFVCGLTPAEGCMPHPSLHRLALCAAIALNLGVILQLAWDEKPLTEPL